MSGKKKPVKREIRVFPDDLSRVLKDAPAGAWIALSRDKTRIVGTGTSIKAASLAAQLHKEDHPVLIKMPGEDEGVAAGVR